MLGCAKFSAKLPALDSGIATFGLGRVVLAAAPSRPHGPLQEEGTGGAGSDQLLRASRDDAVGT